MNNWKEEFKKQFIIYNEDMWHLILRQLNSDKIEDNDLFTFISQVEQDAYKRGLEDKEKIAGNPVKLTYEELMDMEKVKQEGMKEGAMMALDIIATWQGWEESREFYLEKIQQELNKLNKNG